MERRFWTGKIGQNEVIRVGITTMPQNNNEVRINVETGTIIRVLVYIALAVLAAMLFMRILQPLILVLVSFFLAIGLNPTVSWIARHLKSKSRARATGAAYILVISFLTAFISFVFPPLISQSVDFFKAVPGTIQDVKNGNGPISAVISRYNLEDEVNQFSKDIGSRVNGLSKPALSTAGKIGSTIFSVITVFVLTFMMLVEGPMWLKKYLNVLPKDKQKRQGNLIKQMYKVVVGYVNGQVLIAIIGGTVAAITLFIASKIFNVGVNAIALGGIITLFALLPLIGTTIGAIIVVLSSLVVSLPLAIFMAVYFVVYQQIENVTLQPFIQSRSNSLTPLLVFVAAVLGVGLGGMLGAILAIPAAGCIKILVDDYFSRKKAIHP